MVAVMTESQSRAPFDSAARPAGPYSLIVGLGASGLAAARYLTASGRQVVVIDSRAVPPGADTLRDEHPEIVIALETLDDAWIEGASEVVLSPGLSVDLPLVAAAKARGVEVIGELELFARAAEAPVIAVTGSNGKSTVTTLVAYLLEAEGFRAPAGGNLGPPALELLGHGPVDAYVIEVSSFQLETTQSLRPLAAALLNVSPDHIDRHGSLEAYAAIKASLLARAEHAIVNLDDPLVRPLAASHPAPIPISVETPLSVGWSTLEHRGERWLARDLEPLIAVSRLPLPGRIGEANVLAALALADCLGGDIALALAALPAFGGLPHRLELIAERRGVRYIDDSKGTNVGATVAALSGDPSPTVLIAGGRSKGADFAPLAEVVTGRVRAVVLIGEAAAEIEAALGDRVDVRRVDSMDAAVETAAAIAVSGDRVLLSPACASQDMFIDYRDRGCAFERAVRRLAP